MEDGVSQLRRGVLELCILSLIEQGPQYGYEIVTRLAETPQLAAGEGTIYPLLRRLKKEAWLETFWQESAAGPPRQYYRLYVGHLRAGIGSEGLQRMRSEWSQLVGAVGSYLEGGQH